MTNAAIATNIYDVLVKKIPDIISIEAHRMIGAITEGLETSVRAQHTTTKEYKATNSETELTFRQLADMYPVDPDETELDWGEPVGDEVW